MSGTVEESELPELDPRVLVGIELFNREEYFEAHEAIESAWLEEFGRIRPLYQGLIQAAVALHHVGQSNRHGALKLYHSSRAHLLPFGESCKGIQVGRLIRDLDTLFGPVVAGGPLPGGPMPRITAPAPAPALPEE